MPTTVTHTDSLDIVVNFQPQFSPLLRFNKLLQLELEADNNTGVRARSYSPGDLDTIETDWTTRIRDAADDYFSAQPTPDEILIGAWDKAGGETVKEALDAITGIDSGWFYVASSIRTPADLEFIGDTVDGYQKPSVYFLTSDDDSIVDPNTSLATPLDNLGSNALEEVFGIYHPDPASSPGSALAGRLATANPDQESAPFFGRLRNINAYDAPSSSTAWSLPSAADIGTAQSPGEIRGNDFNAVLPFGSAPAWLGPGQNLNGRQGKVILTKFWFKDRLEAEVANEIQTAAAQNEIIPIGAVGESQTEGQVRMAKLLRRQFEIGENAQHFLVDELDINYPQIQQSNVNNDTIPLDAQATVAIGGQYVDFNIFFSRSSVT